MSNAASSEPLPLRTAVVKWAAQSGFGTAASLTTSTGIALASFNKQSNNAFYRGPGSPNFVTAKGGETYADLSLRYPALQTGVKALILKANRASGVVPFISLGIGYEDDQGTSNKSVERFRDVVITGLALAFDASGGPAPLTADLTLFGTVADTVTSLTRATDTTSPWMTYEAAVTNEGSGYPVVAFSLNVAHNVTRDHVAPGSTPASNPRSCTFITTHDEVITGSITRYAAIGHNIQANTLAEKDLVVTFTSLDAGTTVLTVTLNNCIFNNEQHEQTEQGLRWSADFECQTFSLA